MQQNLTQVVQPAPAGTCASYERRRPEETVLYQLVQEHVETFFAQVEAETGAGLPVFVKEEFEAFLACGILASRKRSGIGNDNTHWRCGTNGRWKNQERCSHPWRGFSDLNNSQPGLPVRSFGALCLFTG